MREKGRKNSLGLVIGYKREGNGGHVDDEQRFCYCMDGDVVY